MKRLSSVGITMPIERKLVSHQGAGTGRWAQVSGVCPGGGIVQTSESPHQGGGNRARGGGATSLRLI